MVKTSSKEDLSRPVLSINQFEVIFFFSFLECKHPIDVYSVISYQNDNECGIDYVGHRAMHLKVQQQLA